METVKLAAAAILYREMKKDAGFMGGLGVLGILGALGYGASQAFPNHFGMIKDNLWELISTKMFNRLPSDTRLVDPPREVSTHYNIRRPFQVQNNGIA